MKRKKSLKGTNFQTILARGQKKEITPESRLGLKKYSYGFIALNGINFLFVTAFCSFLAMKLEYINFNQALLVVLAYLAIFYFTVHKFAKKMFNSYISTGKVA